MRDYSYVVIEIRDTKTHAPVADTEIVVNYVCVMCPLTTTPKDFKATTDEDGFALLKVVERYSYWVLLDGRVELPGDNRELFNERTNPENEWIVGSEQESPSMKSKFDFRFRVFE